MLRGSLFAAIAAVLLSAGFATAATYDLSSDWSNTSNPNGPWSYNEGSLPLPLISPWNAANTATWTCNEPAWAPSNTSGGFLPAWFKVAACVVSSFPADPNNSPAGNVAAGDVVVHTNDSSNGDLSKGVANVVFTMPTAASAGSYTVSGAVWDARLLQVGARPQDWKLIINGTLVASGATTGTVSRTQAQTFSVTDTMQPGDRVELDLEQDAASAYGTFVGVKLTIGSSPTVATVNDASFAAGQPVAPNSIASAFAIDLASQTLATGGTLGGQLGGTTANVVDSQSTSAPVNLFFVSPAQVNFLVPAGLANGRGQLQVTSGDGTINVGPIQIQNVAPGIFTADGTLAVGSAVHVDAQGNRTNDVLVQASGTQFAPVPIDLGGATDSTYLILYGTGIGNAPASGVSITIDGQTVTPLYAGPQGQYDGEDQINFQIPNSLKGAGDVAITVTAAGAASNAVHVTIQ